MFTLTSDKQIKVITMHIIVTIAPVIVLIISLSSSASSSVIVVGYMRMLLEHVLFVLMEWLL